MERCALVALLATAGVCCADGGADGGVVEREVEEVVVESVEDEAVVVAERGRPPLGWLSHPDEEAGDIWEALSGGKIHFDNRLRLEWADTTGRDSSTAVTNRIRLGYETKAYYGVSGLIEFENVFAFDEDNYFVPQTGDGSAGRTPVADPTGTRVNQAYGRYATSSLGETGVRLDVRGGRQRILLDDERFVGNVGWRQFEQTYDSVSARSDFGVEGLDVFYAYVWEVKRVFGPDGDDPESDSHLVNVSYEFMPELKVTGLAYLLDFRDDEPLNSTDTYGVRLTGTLWGGDAGERGDVSLGYELTYARQVDAGSNPVEFEVDFIGAEGRVSSKGVGWLALGYQFLGSDDGDFGFRFPLGTNHKFQGFADQFLVTPSDGLQDLYVSAGTEIWGVKPMVSFHQFYTDEGSDDLGWEVDFAVSKQITKMWSVLVKGAFFDGASGQPDTTRLWVQTEVRF